jgi:hypothetical protein
VVRRGHAADRLHFRVLAIHRKHAVVNASYFVGLIESGELGIGCCAFWALQGPSRFNSDSLGFGPLDETFFAEPGTYELFGSFGGFVGGRPGEDPHMVGSESFSLAATFTSIPEPRWAFVAVLFGLLWPLVRHRWCIWSPNMLDPSVPGCWLPLPCVVKAASGPEQPY